MTLRHRVTVEQYARVDDDTGGWSEDWTALGTFWARVRAVGGSEAIMAGALRGEVAWEILLRNVDDEIDVKDRVVWNGRTIKVNAVLPDEKGEWLRLLGKQEGAG